MDDEKNVTAPQGEASSEPEAQATTAQPDEVTTLRSRVAGYTAKVNELTTAQKALLAERDALKAQLDEARRGVVDKDEALRSQLTAKEQEIEAVKREAALARIEAKYPETFAVLGEAAANLTPEKLAEAEARFRGVAAETTEPPKPIGNNPPKTQGAAADFKPLDVPGDILGSKVRAALPAWLRPSE